MELVVSVISSSGELTQALEPTPFYLSSSHEASIRCMIAVAPESIFIVQVQDSDDGSVLCDSDRVPVTSEDWVCLHAESSSTDQQQCTSRLLSYTEDYDNGWTLCLDVRERLNQASVLRNVHVMCHEKRSHVPMTKDSGSPDSGYKSKEQMGNVLDCTDVADVPQLNRRAKPLAHDNSPSPSKALSQKTLLEQLLCSDEAIPDWLLEPSMWRSLSRGLTIGTPNVSEGPGFAVGADSARHVKSQLQDAGYSRLSNVAWADYNVSMHALAETMDSLRSHGFPPVFIYMFEEAWSLWEPLFDVMSEILGEEHLELDASVFAWSLQPTGQANAVGSNFGRPHRDDSYDECHTSDGKVTVVSAWLPLVPVTTHNGCMCVVPANCDPLFARPDSPLHMRPEKELPWAHIRSLTADAGDVLLWQGNLIHWGTACDADAGVPPRKSMATAFMAPGASKEGGISRARLRAGLTVRQRLHLILRGLLIYEDWHPDFDGLDEVLKHSK